MLVYAAYRGYPEFSNVLGRRRLTRLMNSAADRAVLLVGPSGVGKTVTAAEYARGQQLPVVWVSLGGQEPESSALLLAVLGATQQHDAELMRESMPIHELGRHCRGVFTQQFSNGALLVLDDVGLSGCPLPIDAIGAALNELRHCRIRVIMTGRHDVSADRRALVVDQAMLAFTERESVEAARLLGRDDLCEADIRRIWGSCRGHPALTSTLLAAAGGSGSAGELPVEAWAVAQRVASQQLLPQEQQLLDILILLKRAHVEDLGVFGFEDPRSLVGKIADVLPLVRTETSSGPLAVVVHDLLSDEILKPGRLDSLPVDRSLGHHVPAIMAKCGEAQRLAEVACSPAMAESVAKWLEQDGNSALQLLGHEGILRVLELLPLNAIVGHSRLVLLWSRVLLECGHMEDSVSKARLAWRLAEQEQDGEAQVLSACVVTTGLALAGRSHDAWDTGMSYARGLSRGERWLKCELFAALASAAATGAREREFVEVESAAGELAAHDEIRCRRALRKIARAKATLRVTCTGDWIGASRILSPLLADDHADDLLSRIAVRGNLAISLVELGRLDRAQGLLDSVVGCTIQTADAACLPTIAMILAARGHCDEAVLLGKKGLVLAIEAGDEMDAHLSRVGLACVQRVAGDTVGSLETAERAYEGLGRIQVGLFRSLAALEVAASLLAMDDGVAARQWTGLATSTDDAPQYQSLRAAMILAECSRRDGDLGHGVHLLKPHRDEARSENSNWQMAMYVRTFPHLLGMLAMAAGARNLPSHMLRMVLPENVERSLRLAHSFMDREEWMILGRRALGEERFTEYLERKGRPLCRVRMFGGLEVATDERVIRERDWAKRKARAMFAMLVLLRGQEVSRDLILEQLWPDMDPPRAKNNFYVAWSAMKSALVPPEQRDSPCPYVESSRGRCKMVRDWVRSDVDDFEDLIAKARSAEAEGKTQEALSAYSDLASVYRGDLLPGDLYDDWFGPYRDKYRFEFIDAMVRATELLLELDDPWEAQIYIRRAVGIDPFREDLYQVALRCHISAGQRSAAIETFIQCKAQLSDELGLDPSASTLALYQQVLAMEERPRTEGYGLSGLGSEYLLD